MYVAEVCFIADVRLFHHPIEFRFARSGQKCPQRAYDVRETKNDIMKIGLKGHLRSGFTVVSPSSESFAYALVVIFF